MEGVRWQGGFQIDRKWILRKRQLHSINCRLTIYLRPKERVSQESSFDDVGFLSSSAAWITEHASLMVCNINILPRSSVANL